jgi:hypothetical protein
MSGIFRSGSKVAPVFGGTIEDLRGQQFLVDCLDVLETCGNPLPPNNYFSIYLFIN